MNLKRIFTEDGSEYKYKNNNFPQFRFDIIKEGNDGFGIITNTHPNNTMYWRASLELSYNADRMIVIDSDRSLNVVKNRDNQGGKYHFPNDNNIVDKLAHLFFQLEMKRPPGSYSGFTRTPQTDRWFFEAEGFVLENLI